MAAKDERKWGDLKAAARAALQVVLVPQHCRSHVMIERRMAQQGASWN